MRSALTAVIIPRKVLCDIFYIIISKRLYLLKYEVGNQIYKEYHALMTHMFLLYITRAIKNIILEINVADLHLF